MSRPDALIADGQGENFSQLERTQAIGGTHCSGLSVSGAEAATTVADAGVGQTFYRQELPAKVPEHVLPVGSMKKVSMLGDATYPCTASGEALQTRF